MATSSNEEDPTASFSQHAQHPNAGLYGPHFPLRQVHVDLWFKLYRRFGSEAFIHTYRSPKDCFVTLDPTSITFELFKELVIQRVGEAHNHLATKSCDQIWASVTPKMRWSVGITINEAALFRNPAVMPTEHDEMFKQWIWGIKITQQGRPNLSLVHDLSDAPHEEHMKVGGDFAWTSPNPPRG
ncbi:hypothetical protein Pst134EA_031878 [Puccinia striiformis f. sp. tritici]|uniref:uncharacterized protein n=1 Tax=Puccinia striiformis f. sp. tritici TaxID=168172 RepID=UPI00200765F2|nr:uncharacterized protein Pst134EA_031878 [Puccinia striiformis f. sp. tritici]KAH9440628.1 hypothetical protein Pst134EA_031878 [Puccinia striiformis f. sp. tritici]